MRQADNSPEFDKGWEEGKKQGKKDAASGEDLWATLEAWKKKNPVGDSDYNMGYSVGYEIIAKDTHGTKRETPVGHFGWLSKSGGGYKFRPKSGASSVFTGPSAKEKMRYHLRNSRNIPAKDIEEAMKKVGSATKPVTASTINWPKSLAFAKGIKEAALLLIAKCQGQEELQAVQSVFLILENVQDALKALDQSNTAMGLSSVLGRMESELKAMKDAYESGE
jgi:hypothetical protein